MPNNRGRYLPDQVPVFVIDALTQIAQVNHQNDAVRLVQFFRGRAQRLDCVKPGLQAVLAVLDNFLRLIRVRDAQAEPGQRLRQGAQVFHPGIRQHGNVRFHQCLCDARVRAHHLGDRRHLHIMRITGRLDDRGVLL